MNIFINRLDNLYLMNKKPHNIFPEQSDSIVAYIGKINDLDLNYKNLINKNLETSFQLSRNDKNIIMSKPVFSFIYKSDVYEINLNNKNQMDKYYGNQSRKFQELVSAFCIALWLIKDNSVSSTKSYHCNLMHRYEQTINLDLSITNSAGILETTKFSNEEIKTAISLMYIVHRMMTKSVDKIDIKNHNNNGTIFWSREEYIGHEFMKDDTFNHARVLLYLQEARSTGAITTKISKYCACLECIFAIKDQHTKNIKEITSKLIGKSREEQEKIYLDMHDAYKIRSNIEHGGQILYLKEHSKADIMDLSKRVDNYVRESIKYIIENPELKYRMGDSDRKAEVRKYFKIIGDSTVK